MEAFHREQLREGNVELSFFFSKCGRGILDISMATDRHVGEGEQFWKSV